MSGDSGFRDASPSESALLAGCAVGFAGLALALLGPVLHGPFFADDWELYLADPRAHIAGAFFEARPYEIYRPIQLALVALSQSLFGYGTLPVHLVNLGLHLALALLVIRALLSSGVSRAGAVLGGLYLCVSQLAASAVGGNDTISLTLGTLAGSTALFLMSPLSRDTRPRLGLAAAAFALALFAKESSFGYLPILALLVWLRFRREPGGVRTAVLWKLVFLAIAVVYLAARAHAGGAAPDLASGRQMRLASNVLVNAAQLALAAVIPLPTTQIFLGLSAREWLWPIAGALSAAALVAFLCWGMGRAGKLGLLASFALAGGVLLGPVLLLNHVSELYAYAVLPFVSVLFGWSAGSLLTRSGRRVQRVTVAAFATFALCANGWAQHQDARGMVRSGESAAELMPQLMARLASLPPGGVVVLVDPPAQAPNYSVFRVTGFRGVALTGRQLQEMTGRDDVRMRIVLAGEPLPERCEACEFLTLDAENRLVPMP